MVQKTPINLGGINRNSGLGQPLSGLPSKANKPTKKLLLAQGREETFSLETISFDDIETMTRISPLNPRYQEELDEVEVSDILTTLPDKGQQEPAHGYRDENGTICIFDGSRRRYTILLVGEKGKKHSFKVWVASNEISDLDYIAFDKVTEAKLKRTAIENGTYWNKLKAKHNLDSYPQLAELIGQPLSTVQAYCLAAETPEHLLELAYSPKYVGKALAKKLVEIADMAGEGEVATTLAQAKSDYLKSIATKLHTFSKEALNQKVVNFLYAKAKELHATKNDLPLDESAKFEDFFTTKKNHKVASKSEIKAGLPCYTLQLKLPNKHMEELTDEIERLVIKKLQESYKA
ncbi:hypothetical protein AB4254_13710 [Vibrio breoganii]